MSRRPTPAASTGGLDEHEIARLLADGAPIDGFGVGTGMGVAKDAPALDIAYKLTAYAGRGRLKLSSGKRILPGPKQVRRREEDGEAVGDVIGRAGEELAGRPLLEPVMRGGERWGDVPLPLPLPLVLVHVLVHVHVLERSRSTPGRFANVRDS